MAIKDKKIAIFVNTFLRDDLIPRFVECCEKITNSRLYISDNGRVTDEKSKLYSKLIHSGHKVYLPKEFNYWWRKAFNDKLILLQDEEYILKIDDDFILNKDSNIEKFIEILDNNPDIGLIGGQVWHVRNNRKSDYIFKVMKENKDGVFELKVMDFDDKDLIYSDYTPDFWMARRELFDTIKMRENLKPAEGAHELFFRDIYKARKLGVLKLKVAYTDKVIAFHEKGGNTEEYKKHRYGGFNPETYKKNIKMIKNDNKK